MIESEMTCLRQAIEAEYLAARRGLYGYSITARHDFINSRMDRIARYHEQLQHLVGEQEATQVLIAINDDLVSNQGDENDYHAEDGAIPAKTGDPKEGGKEQNLLSAF